MTRKRIVVEADEFDVANVLTNGQRVEITGRGIALVKREPADAEGGESDEQRRMETRNSREDG